MRWGDRERSKGEEDEHTLAHTVVREDDDLAAGSRLLPDHRLPAILKYTSQMMRVMVMVRVMMELAH